MEPKRSLRPIMQKTIMITIILSILIIPSAIFISKPASSEKEIGILLESNRKILALNEVEEIEEPEINEYEQILIENQNLIKFYSDMFNIPENIILEDLKLKSLNEEIIDINNLGFLKDEENNLITHANIDLGLIEYFEDYIEKNPEYKKNKIIPYEGDSEYIKSLIAHFTNVYENVDYNIAITIGAAESGHYTVKYMKNVNNMFGIMYNGRLIRYHNIEYGIYRYIKLLNNNYFGKGLTTFETIGRYYCPETINGIRQASPHWLSLVNNIKHKYQEHNIITIEDVISTK